MKKIVSILAMVALLAGCGTSKPAPDDHFYRMADLLVTGLSTPLVDGAITVRRFRSDGLHGERAIVFTSDSDQIVLQQYHYHFWVESPQTLLQKSLIAYLRDAQAAEFVSASHNRNAKLKIASTIRRFEHIRGGGQSQVAIVLEFDVRQAEGSSSPVLLKEYTALIDLSDKSMSTVAAGFAAGAGQIYGQLLADLEIRMSGGK